MRAFFAGLFCCGVLLSPSAQALDIPPKPQDYVYDAAGVVSPAVESRLNAALYQLEQATSNQIVVAVFPSLENEALEDFSIRLAEAWKPGQRGKDNGVLLLIFKQERLMRIEVGYGLEGALTDAEAGLIIQQVMAPHFREGNFEGGITAGVGAIAKAIQEEFQGRPSSPYGPGSESRPLTPEEAEALRQQGRLLGLGLLAAVLGLLMVDLCRYGTYWNQHRVYRDRYTFWEWFFRFAILLAVISFIFRMIFYAMLFSRGGSGGSRGGGFSSGGGSFGGGGASGRW